MGPHQGGYVNPLSCISEQGLQIQYIVYRCFVERGVYHNDWIT